MLAASGVLSLATQSLLLTWTRQVLEGSIYAMLSHGLTTGGLGATDIGNKKAIGGISREFYANVFTYYADPAKWKQQTREQYYAKRPHGNSSTETTMWTFEPHAATEIYDAMLAKVKASSPSIVPRSRQSMPVTSMCLRYSSAAKSV